jgi:hypothetical protein
MPKGDGRFHGRLAGALRHLACGQNVKHALPRGSSREMVFRRGHRNLDALDVVDDPGRIRGGNWKMQGFRRSGHRYDESESQMSIDEFMANTRERQDIVE